MSVNGEAIYATSASPFKRLPWGRCTKKALGMDTILYLHIFDWPAEGKLLVRGLKNDVKSARLLAGGKELKAANVDPGVEIELPLEAPDKVSTTVVLEIEGDANVEDVLLVQEADGSVSLDIGDAQLSGKMRFESAQGRRYIGFWTNPEDVAIWTFHVNEPGMFSVTGEIAALNSARFEIICDGQVLAADSPATGDYAEFAQIEIPGKLDISSPGSHTLTVKPVAEDWRPMNLRALTLKPARQ
ncbi:MAG: hypothetical protein BWZ10_03397 [candidate division BRC1 bacterium ADurb.BinA364]|nr:MAG: hypothetical protein BWZ10_03397 [candidate division BRC1 bacterium ADurb.BinA364]